MSTKYRPILETFVLSLLVFVLHELFFLSSNNQTISINFRYAVSTLYLFFFSCSITIILILTRMSEKNIDSVGQTFLLLTSIKMVLAYGLLYPILQDQKQILSPEKINFFITFALFLTIETIIAIRILNKKH
ncbi:hypothetical protein [Flavobacterium aciduliphilum]|uniref:Uncharacterized protein n=1 Tax=Flavobacterium aciduliphilum TaxID=1101402 RepID=A0A328YDX8_9FLAO|nr:hypothetical protein [Flavobacterium aciduliphilum]RAR71333.1 hypothetical protein CLV55_10870 [Flavobacterium aciduliphilum]